LLKSLKFFEKNRASLSAGKLNTEILRKILAEIPQICMQEQSVFDAWVILYNILSPSPTLLTAQLEYYAYTISHYNDRISFQEGGWGGFNSASIGSLIAWNSGG
jgi:hypothetical protein